MESKVGWGQAFKCLLHIMQASLGTQSTLAVAVRHLQAARTTALSFEQETPSQPPPMRQGSPQVEGIPFNPAGPLQGPLGTGKLQVQLARP